MQVPCAVAQNVGETGTNNDHTLSAVQKETTVRELETNTNTNTNTVTNIQQTDKA